MGGVAASSIQDCKVQRNPFTLFLLLRRYRKFEWFHGVSVENKRVVSWGMEFWIASRKGEIPVSSGNENLSLEVALRHSEARLQCQGVKGSLQAGDWNAEAQGASD